MNDATIAEYLRRLDQELRLKRAPRRRLLAEAEDHLRSAVEELVGEGRAAVDAEHEAVARFGAAAEVARRFAHAAASSTARAAVAWAGAAFFAYALTAGFFLVTAPSWLRDFPHGAPSMLALQIAAVALAVTIVRALHWRRTLIVEEHRLRLIANGALIAALAVAAGAVAETVLALTRPAPAPWADASALLAAFGLAAVVCVRGAFITTAAFARASSLRALPGRPASVGGNLTLAEDVAAVAPVLSGFARAALRRPGWSCAALAGSAFVAVSVSDPAVGAIEAAAIVVGFLTLARPLGLR
jgi:HAAS